MNNKTIISPVISVAPMMDWTDRHCRYFHRLIAPSVTLYTEMVTTGALLHGDAQRFLRFDVLEHPVVLQLGGSDPAALAQSAKLGEEAGYDQINLNCGCPSDRVQSGAFGAVLMKNPALVRDCIAAMREAVDIPVTVKCRIGVDDCEDESFLTEFIGTVAEGGCELFIIHARKAWLKGLSPKENREIPPLDYDLVQQIVTQFPNIEFHLNGGLRNLDQLIEQNEFFKGLMIGREAYQHPWSLRVFEEHFYASEHLLDRREVVAKMIEYIKEQKEKYDTPMKSITRHMTGLFQGEKGARRWRQMISVEAHKPETKPEFLLEAMPEMD